MLPWSHTRQRLESTFNYWLITARPDGHPSASPVWGVWLGDAFYFEGGPQTRRGRNITANPQVVVHLESGDDVVIVEGTAQEVVPPEPALALRVAGAFTDKYLLSHNYKPDPAEWDQGGFYVVRPHTVIAWTQFPKDATRWQFRSND
jgi:nitroimidazol reductase NimA-like FMN-containing flavoprotein (pyridoxamine 5'-phosphate oxidase superfamily)